MLQRLASTLIRFKHKWTGSVELTQHARNIQVVSLKDFGAKLDGVTDDTAAVQRAIDALPYNQFMPDTQIPRVNHEYSTYWLDGSGGIALVSDSIVLHGGVNIRNMCLRANFGTDGNSWNSKPVLKTDGARFWGDAHNITIDGNHAKCKGVVLSHVFGGRWDNISIYNTQLECFTNLAPGYEFNLTNYRFTLSGYGRSQGATYQDTVSALYVTAGDGRYEKGDSLFAPIGVYAAGNNYFSNIHCWSGYYNNGFAGQIEMRIGFLIATSGSTFDRCYADSPSKKDYTLSNSYGLPDGLPNGGVGFYLRNGAWNNTFIGCKWIVNDTLYSACTDVRVGKVDQLRGFLMEGDNTNNRIQGFIQPPALTYVGDFIFGAASEQTTMMVGVERRSNRFYTRVTGQPIIDAVTQDTGITKLLRFISGSKEVGFIQLRDTDSLRSYANRSNQIAVGSAAPIEYYAGSDGAQAPTLRPMQTGVANLGDTAFRYITSYLTTNPNVSSDVRLKSEIEDVPEALIRLAASTPIKRYKLNSTGEYHYGIVITPEFVESLMDADAMALMGMLTEGEDGMYGIAYADWQNILLEGLRRSLANTHLV